MKEKEVALIAHTFNPFINKEKDHPFKNLNCWSGVNPLRHGFKYLGTDGKAHKFSYKQCDIYFTLPTIPLTIMPSLYHSANVGIYISRGEGWGLPEIESLACGLPCIITDCLGHIEYLKNTPETQQKLIIPSMGSEIASDGIWFNGDQGEWDIIDYEKFENLLLSTYENKNDYQNKNEEISDYITKNYSWNKAIESLINTFNLYQ